MRGEPTELEKKQSTARDLAANLRLLRACEFSVEDLALLLKTDWSDFKHEYYEEECDRIIELAKEQGIE